MTIAMFDNATADGNFSQERQLLGTLLSLQDLLEGNVTRRKRQSPIRVFNDFFNSLDGDMAMFGLLSSSFPANLRTLAFVIDDTGSMADEISSAQIFYSNRTNYTLCIYFNNLVSILSLVCYSCVVESRCMYNCVNTSVCCCRSRLSVCRRF